MSLSERLSIKARTSKVLTEVFVPSASTVVAAAWMPEVEVPLLTEDLEMTSVCLHCRKSCGSLQRDE